MFPDMGEKTVISIVLQILKTIISDGDLLDSLRCLMLDGSLFFFTTIPPTTGYHSVRIFILLHATNTTTTDAEGGKDDDFLSKIRRKKLK